MATNSTDITPTPMISMPDQSGELRPSRRPRGRSGGDRPRGNVSGGRGPRGGRDAAPPEFEQKMINIRRVTRVVKGGRRFSFSVLLAIGNRCGKVGLGVGKAADISLSLEKAFREAKKHLLTLTLTKESSIPHEVTAKFNSSRVIIRPAPGRGIVAGSAMRVILELAGIRAVGAKILSPSKSQLNNARATMRALSTLPVSIRS
ncbi:MAG: 30S ribosomal protein S5 [Patescibacteria group bacterium]